MDSGFRIIRFYFSILRNDDGTNQIRLIVFTTVFKDRQVYFDTAFLAFVVFKRYLEVPLQVRHVKVIFF